MTSLAAPAPRAVTATTESTSVLAKRVNARGLCTTAPLTADQDPWFPVTRAKAELEEKARSACSGCPVLAECRELALRTESEFSVDRIHGIFGGLAPHERIEAIKARRGGGVR
ncbi:WhiB family transcriptional regulator [Micromonospora aurantiaca (nom. illeg.)]